MRPLRFLSTPILLLVLVVAAAQGQTPTPSPTCQVRPTDAYLEASVEVYEPGVPFTVTLMRPNDADWPTTPLGFSWATNFTDPEVFIAGETIELTVSPPGPDIASIACYCQGYGIRPDCPAWSSNEPVLYLSRFDYVPTPTPTPSPIPTPSPTPICTPLPCSERFPYPPPWAHDIPLSFTMTASDGAYFIYLREDDPPYTEVSVEVLGDSRWRVVGLKPLTEYELFFHCGVDCNGSSRNALSYFTTGDGSALDNVWILSKNDTEDGSQQGSQDRR